MPGKTDIWDEFKNHPKEFALPEGRIQDCVGTPDMLRTRLREFESVGIDQVICISQAGKIPHELLCSSMELFSREVLPEFKDRELAGQRKKAEQVDRISAKAMARKLPVEGPKEQLVIRAAGHH